MTLFGRQLKFFKGPFHAKTRRCKHCPIQADGGMSLADVGPGCFARIAGFSTGLPAERCSHLQAYGITPGYSVRVVQHSPVTVVQVDHLELALERELACLVQVESMPA